MTGWVVIAAAFFILWIIEDPQIDWNDYPDTMDEEEAIHINKEI